MDHDRWTLSLSRSHNATTTTTNSTSQSKTHTTGTANRYQHDLEQAHAMRGRRTNPARHTVIDTNANNNNNNNNHDHSTNHHRTRQTTHALTTTDVYLGLKGLEEADCMRKRGELDAALKLYELALELLIRCLKWDENWEGIDLETLRERVRVAMSEAEEIKDIVRRQGNGPLHTKPSTKNDLDNSWKASFQALVASLTSVLASCPPQRKVSPKTSPTNSINTTRGGGTKPIRPIPPSTNEDDVVGVAGTTRTGSIHPSNPTPNEAATNNETRQAIINEFYVPPGDLQKISWDDIAGLDTVKQALQETAILPLMRPDLFTGLRRPQNILLWGPPGTGKTMLVRAVARESESHLFVCTASSLTSKWMGESEKLVRTLFQIAREMAPAILFLDEMDAVLSSRKSDGEHEASRRLKTEFMVQMDGIIKGGNDDDQRHVLVLACTNCPWDVDSAVLRRFPRRLLVPLPDAEARRGLLDHLLTKAGKHTITATQKRELVKRFEGFSCSDITSIASEASFGPLRSLGGVQAIRKARATDVRPIDYNDFDTALRQATKSVSSDQIRKYEDWQTQQGAK